MMATPDHAAPARMPFGKHRGTPLGELPGPYVEWLGAKLDEWYGEFRVALVVEIERRKGSTATTATANHATRGPARRRPARRPASELPAPGACDVGGLPASAQRPLVHESCLHDEVPF